MMREFIGIVSMTIVFTWTIAGAMTLVVDDHPAGMWLLRELRPLYLPAVVVGYGLLIVDELRHGHLNIWSVLGLAASIANWFNFKNKGDDDRWKRRIERLSGVVARVGSRLTVVPAGGEA